MTKSFGPGCGLLVLSALLLLVALGRMDLLIILLPLSLLFALAIGCSGRRHNQLTPGVKKG